MSVNLWIHVSVRDHRPEREAAIGGVLDDQMKGFESGWEVGQAAAQLIRRKGRLVPEIQVDTADPVIISGSGPWEQELSGRVRDAVFAANGRPCTVDVLFEDADELRAAGRRPKRLPPRVR